MELNLTTFGFLFSAVSLLFLAYTNRFLATGQLIRSLGNSIDNKIDSKINQIENLKKRMELIRWTQIFGALCLINATISAIFIFFKLNNFGELFFFISLLTMLMSLILLLIEIYISTIALNLELNLIREKK